MPLTLKLKQPQGFYVIALGEMCERFNYYGIQMLLVLYLTTNFSFSDDKSYSLYGAYAAFAFALPVLGGLVADRLLGLKQVIIIGGLLLIFGNLLMSIQQINSFYLGLALTVCGIGLYKPTSASFIGKLYGAHDARRETGFTLFYISMNIGATVSPFLYGFIKPFGYQYSYLINATLLLISWLFFLVKIYPNNQLADSKLPQPSLAAKRLAYILIIVVIGLVNVLLLHPDLLNKFLLACAVIAIVMLLATAFKQQAIARNRLLALLILSIFGMCFFTASLQVGSAINLFIQRDINRVIFGWQIPTIMFTSLYPLAVIVAAPFITALWSYLASHGKEPAVPAKLSLSLLLASAGFICFMLAALSSQHNTTGHMPIVWVLMGNLALGTGELCLMPAMFVAISRLAPSDLQSTMMGVWYLFIAFGCYLSSIAAKISSHSSITNSILSSAIYSQAFINIAIATFFIACLLAILIPWIKSLMKIS